MLPPVVWLSGLFHPEGFVAAVLIHHSLVNRWPLAETVLETEVLQHFPDEFVGDEAVRPDGVRVHGFHLDKASWDIKRGVIERLPAHLVGLTGGTEMPVILLKGVRRISKDRESVGDSRVGLPRAAISSTFDCPAGKNQDDDSEEEDLNFAVPVYRTQKRMAPVVLRALLPSVCEHETWILLGVSILLDPYV